MKIGNRRNSSNPLYRCIIIQSTLRFYWQCLISLSVCVSDFFPSQILGLTSAYWCVMLSFISKYKMPPKIGDMCCETETKDVPGGSGRSVTTKASLELPVSAVAGLRGADAEAFEEYADSCERACPSVHCWTPAGEILLGCSTGELLKVTALCMFFKHVQCTRSSFRLAFMYLQYLHFRLPYLTFCWKINWPTMNNSD